MDKRQRPNPQRDEELRAALFGGVARNELSLAQAIRLMQKLSTLTQPEFASHRGVSLKALRHAMDLDGNPTVHTLNKIGAVFGLEVGFVPKKRPRPGGPGA